MLLLGTVRNEHLYKVVQRAAYAMLAVSVTSVTN